VSSPTFSPDGTRIAYLVRALDGDDMSVWVADADGSNAHEILANEPALTEGVFGLTWSPSGDRIAMDNSIGRVLEIYTFAPDGSDFTTVITGGMNPVWSPDGSQIAYMVPYGDRPGGDPPGLAIADADGSNVRTFGLAMTGPWHPGTLEKGAGG
jgi:Tol biopolymer transport system component